MQRIAVDSLTPGMRLARPLLDPNGRTLLGAGVPLDETRIRRLHERGLLTVDVVTAPWERQLPPPGLLTDALRGEMERRLRRLYELAAEREEAAARAGGRSVRNVVKQAARAEAQTKAVLALAPRIIREVLGSDGALVVGGLRTRDGALYQHALDVAATAVLLGSKIRLPDWEIAHLVAGCLVIDIGHLFTPPELLGKRGPLTLSEERQLEEHAATGHRLLSELGWPSAMARHVAYQHHERQDGCGYPRRLHGTNRIKRSRAEHYSRELIVQIAEVAAIADAFSNAVAELPYDPARSVEDAVSRIRQGGGSQYNQEMVDTFTRLVPAYPHGAMLSLTNRRGRTWRAVVVRQEPGAPDRPVVRPLQGQERVRLGDELRTSLQPDVQLTPLNETVLGLTA